MAEVMGQQRAAWNGAVNILYAPSQTGFVRSRLFLSEEVTNWGYSQHDRVANLLAWVTSSTNVSRHRRHIRPEGVMQLALRRRMQAARLRSNEMDAAQLRFELEEASSRATEQAKYFDELVEENAQLETAVSDLMVQLADSQNEIAKKEFGLTALKEQLSKAGGRSGGDVETEIMLDLSCRNDPPSPLECLNLIDKIYNDTCVILPSARTSADRMDDFMYGRQLLNLLRRLFTSYRSALMAHGDNEARKIFGQSEYAAKESETVMASKPMRRQRTFEYDGKEVEMFRHLKIGVGDDVRRTIRVHFHWDPINGKIVIGYCGEHLSISGR